MASFQHHQQQLAAQQLLMQQAQAQLMGQLAAPAPPQVQQWVARRTVTTALQPASMPTPQPPQLAQQPPQLPEQAQQQAQPPKRRRGRPPKADGSGYSAAYLQLKQYRARKRNEVRRARAWLRARATWRTRPLRMCTCDGPAQAGRQACPRLLLLRAALLPLLRRQMEEMEAALAAKAAQLAALQAERDGLRDKHDALTAAIRVQDRMVAQLSALQLAAGGSASGASGGRQQGGPAPAEVASVVAAITGRPADAAGDGAAAAATDGSEQAAAAGSDADWAGIQPQPQTPAAAAAGGGRGYYAAPLLPEQLEVPRLLACYKGYVASAAAQLAALAAALQAARPHEFEPGRCVAAAKAGQQAAMLCVLHDCGHD